MARRSMPQGLNLTTASTHLCNDSFVCSPLHQAHVYFFFLYRGLETPKAC